MHPDKLALAAALGAGLAHAELELNLQDVPQACQAICSPIAQLSRTCDVDDDVITSDRTEDLLELQCFCTNTSFDVARISGLCQSCIAQNRASTGNSGGALGDINEIISKCGFASTSYNPSSDASAAATVAVSATKPTATSDLTTTFVPHATSSVGTTPGANGTSGGNSPSTTTSGGSSQTTPPGNAAPAAIELKSGTLFGLLGVAAVGALFM